MPAGEVLREQWVRFFDDFSKKHEGWIATVEVLGSDLGDQEESAGLPLTGISADVKANESRVEIILGGAPGRHLTRIIDKPKRIWLKLFEVPEHEAIEVESDDGTRTLLTFRHILPEEVERQLPEKTSTTS